MRNLYTFLLLVLISFSWTVTAQKTLTKRIDAAMVEQVNIKADGFFKLGVETHSEDMIEIMARFEGENFDEQILQISRSENAITFGLDWNPAFERPDDKLAAHKLNSAELILKIPEKLDLNAKGRSGIILVSGNYRSIKLESDSGSCQVKATARRADIRTHEGDIRVITKNARVSARSRLGNVINSEISKGSNSWSLQSNKGNITIAPME